jgi:hypothetical protein
MPTWLDKFKEHMEKYGDKPATPSPWNQEALDFFKQDLPYQDPVNRGVATPEMVAEQSARDELMQNAEFRPATKREKNMADLLNKLLKEDEYSNLIPKEIKETAKKELLEKFNPEDYTPQVDEFLRWRKKPGEDWYTSERQIEEIKKKDPHPIEQVWPGQSGRSWEEIKRDFKKIGYDEPAHADFSYWQKTRDLQLKPMPETVYHKTDKRNIESIAKEGITPADYSKREADLTSELGKDLQKGRSFWAKEPIPLQPHIDERMAKLRTKSFNKELYPDLGAGDMEWYQTKKAIHPKNLEIEASPGVWEPLIEYMKKRGK